MSSISKLCSDTPFNVIVYAYLGHSSLLETSAPVFVILNNTGLALTLSENSFPFAVNLASFSWSSKSPPDLSASASHSWSTSVVNSITTSRLFPVAFSPSAVPFLKTMLYSPTVDSFFSHFSSFSRPVTSIFPFNVS